MERNESDEKKLRFDEHRTTNHGIIVGNAGTNVIQEDYGCCCKRVEKNMESTDFKFIFAWTAENGIGRNRQGDVLL